MSLGEFLISIEANDGLQTPGQVEELVTLMHEETDSEVKDALRTRKLHSSIARAIAKTKSTTCLGQFVKLGGTRYIIGWLDEVIQSLADTSEPFSEESVVLHLLALKQLHGDNEKLISSGVLDTVKSLCDHNSTKIKDKARELLDSWKDVRLTVALEDIEKVEAHGGYDGGGVMQTIDEESTLLEGSAIDFKLTKHNMYAVEAGTGKAPDFKGPDCLLLVAVENIKPETTDCQKIDPVSLGQAIMEERVIGVINAGISGAECCAATPAEGIVSTDSVNSSRQEMHKKNSNAHVNTDNVKLTDVVDIISENLEVVSSKKTSDPQNFEGSSAGASVAMTVETVPEPKSQSNMDCREAIAPMKDGFSDDAKIVLSEKNRGLEDLGVQKSLSRGNLERVGSTLDDITAVTSANSDVGVKSRVDDDYSKGSAIQNLARDTKSSSVADMRPDTDLDYGIIDAIEVAREVAKAVEKEMVDDRSSENKSDASVHSGTHDSINEKDSLSGNLLEESSSELEMPSERLSEGQELSSADKTDTEPANSMDVDQLGESTQEVQVMCDFDLNQEAACENLEIAVEENWVHTVDKATSQSHVVASQFAGSDGWKEYAATIAFHQTSLPRAASSADAPPHPISIFGKQKQCFLGIDLNVAGGGEENDVISLSGEETTSPSNILPNKLFVAGPRKSGMLEVDLNSMSDVDDAPSSSSLRTDKQHWSNFKGHLSSSSASSLSSIQPMVNTDLNEGLPIQSMPSRLHPFFGVSSTHNSFNAREDAKPVISIMGARVEVSRTDSFFDAPSLPNSKDDKHVTEATIGSMGSYLGVGHTGSHTYPSHFGYTNMNTGPTVPFLSPMFTPGNTMTYMVDPRVYPVPQVLGSSPVIPSMHTQPPFFTSMAGPYPGFNAVMTSGPDFDMNLGFKAGVNGQDLASRQLFISNGGRFIGEHLNPDSLSSSSLGKRKEPETGWETYPYNLKHQYPPGNQ